MCGCFDNCIYYIYILYTYIYFLRICTYFYAVTHLRHWYHNPSKLSIYLFFLSCGMPGDGHVPSKHVADLCTTVLVVFWMDLFCAFNIHNLQHSSPWTLNPCIPVHQIINEVNWLSSLDSVKLSVPFLSSRVGIVHWSWK